LGLGHAISCARRFVGSQPFAAALGDSIIGLNARSGILRRMIRCFSDRKAEAVIAFEELPRARVPYYGVAKPKEDGEIFELEDVVEKPGVEEAPSNLAIAARYVFAPTIFEALEQIQPGAGGEYQLTDAIRLVIRGGGKVYGMRLNADERRYDVGNFNSYFRAFVEFALADDKCGPALRSYLKNILT
jgi:UTP--glucose-1-phosphate uridylyltransferase